jgi:hypothetical protein
MHIDGTPGGSNYNLLSSLLSLTPSHPNLNGFDYLSQQEGYQWPFFLQWDSTNQSQNHEVPSPDARMYGPVALAQSRSFRNALCRSRLKCYLDKFVIEIVVLDKFHVVEIDLYCRVADTSQFGFGHTEKWKLGASSSAHSND